MSALLEKARNIDFTGLNRAFGRGKHSAVPLDGDERGIRGGPQGVESNSRFGFADDGDGPSPLTLGLRGAQIFFAFIAMCIYAACASFQSSNKVGPSFGVILSIILAVEALLHSVLFLVVPIVYDRTDRLKGVARALRQIRVGFVVNGVQTGLMIVASLLTTISAYTQGCANPDKDPHSDKKGYKDKLSGFCRNKRAGAAFFWFAFIVWAATLGLVLKQWYQTRKQGPKIPGFTRPDAHSVEESSAYDPHDEDYETGPFSDSEGVRPSGDYYGSRPLFSDGGYGRQSEGGEGLSYQPPNATDDDFARRSSPPPRPAYTDPYEGIRQSLQLDHRNDATPAPSLPQPPRLPPLYGE